jgi:hypothetical protein
LFYNEAREREALEEKTRQGECWSSQQWGSEEEHYGKENVNYLGFLSLLLPSRSDKLL